MALGNVRLTLETKRALWGYAFVSPFVIGFLTFFLYPFLQAVVFSMNSLKVTQGGYELIPIGLDNYYRALFINPEFTRTLVDSIFFMLSQLPLIVIFSFFAATLLNQKFRGRAAARAIFFLPVIITSGIIARMDGGDMLVRTLMDSTEAAENTELQLSMALIRFLLQVQLHPMFIEYIVRAVASIHETVISSGVQILVFLAGLQSIPPSLYEASNMEGASGWENFWKITFPMVSPLILVNMVYSVVNIFLSHNNTIMQMIRDVAFAQNNYGLSTAYSLIYFIVILIILGVLTAFVSKRVFYYD